MIGSGLLGAHPVEVEMMKTQEILDKLGALKEAATVDRVFGEPRTVGERTIIPVAEVRHGMGFRFGPGSGQHRAAEEGGQSPEGEGSGGGGGGAVSRPIGVVEVTSQGTSFIPIKAPGAPLAGLFIGLAFGMVMCLMKDKCKCGGVSNDGG